MSAETNGLAIASLALALLWFGGLGSLAAVVFGTAAKAQISERGEAGNGLATAGIVIGLFGLVSTVLLAPLFVFL